MHGALATLTRAACDLHHGGYVERFDWTGAPLDPGFKRVRVAGRQTYVFAQAAMAGVAGAHEAARHGAEFLTERCRRDDGQFMSRLTTSGAVLDATADLYDIAFALFALAWWHRASGEERPVAIADASIVHLRETMRSPSGRGFVAREGDTGPHQQNPHMHLFEAAIFLTAFTNSRHGRDLADEVFELAKTRLFDPATGTLAEQFDSEWRREAGSIRIEPGHHYEWVWLLCRYGEIADVPEAYAMAEQLFAFAQAHGHHPETGLIHDAVDEAGRVIAADLRIWPNTEYLKAQVALREQHGGGPGFDDEAVAENLSRIFHYFLTPRPNGAAHNLPRGLWIDYLSHPTLSPKCDHVPASTAYHIMFGFAEVLRHSAGYAPFGDHPW